MFIIFGGLPGVGKTAIARQVAQKLSAVYLRIDSLELALVRSGLVNSQWDLGPAGYIAGYALAADNLRLGLSVVADSVNPLRITRDAWRDVAVQEGVDYLEVEVVCSDAKRHRERVECRSSDIPGLVLPDWQGVITREYDLWDREHIVLDAAELEVEEAVSEILNACEPLRRRRPWRKNSGHS